MDLGQPAAVPTGRATRRIRRLGQGRHVGAPGALPALSVWRFCACPSIESFCRASSMASSCRPCAARGHNRIQRLKPNFSLRRTSLCSTSCHKSAYWPLACRQCLPSLGRCFALLMPKHYLMAMGRENNPPPPLKGTDYAGQMACNPDLRGAVRRSHRAAGQRGAICAWLPVLPL